MAKKTQTLPAHRMRLPKHKPTAGVQKHQYSRPVHSCQGATHQFQLALQALHPVVRLGHRIIGNVGVRYREIMDFEFIAILDGHGDFYLGQESYRYQPGTLLFIPPSVPHTLISRSGPDGDHLALHFDLSPKIPGKRRMQNYAVHILDAPQIAPVMDLDKTGLAFIADAITQHRAQNPSSDLRASIAVQRLFLHLIAHQHKRQPDQQNDEAILTALTCIDEHFMEPLSVDDLAAAAGLQRSRFAERFKAWSGRPPMAFLRRYRIDRAAELLDQETDRSLASIADACGFADAFSFSKAFKAELGMSPSAYRQRDIGV